ncbi:MAG: hypothetical protein HZA52_14115 [Planctomycetes bacterium]|nr:hypothetical protein [Planctomycetota bacterium]
MQPDAQATSARSLAPDPDVDRAPALPRGALLAILAATLVLQLVAWSMQRGYPLADVVEYLERARHWVLGVQVGNEGTIRSFAFSALFVPLFAIDRWFGIEDARWVMPAAQLIGIAIGLAFVWAVARLGARVGGVRAGLAAALVAGANPIFLLHSVWPLADIAAAACLALGLEAFVERRSRRREFAGGLWLGLAFVLAYKTLPVIALVATWCFARDRFRRTSAWRGLVGGVAIAVALQVVLDRWMYGEWGGSVWRYVVDNTGSVLTTTLARLGLVDAARAVYEAQSSLRDFPVLDGETTTRQLLPKTWYLEHLTSFLSWPVLALGVFGLFRVARARLAAGVLLIALVVVHATLTSMKGDKSFRLWMPILPALAVLAGLGFEQVRGAFGGANSWGARVRAPGAGVSANGPSVRATGVRVSAVLAAALLFAAVALAPFELQRQTPRRYGVFWDAMDYVNGVVEAHPLKSGRRFRVSSSFYWGPYLRNVPEAELVRVWPPLDFYPRLGPGAKKAVQKQLDGLDILILHVALLAEQPALVGELNSRYGVLAAFHDPSAGEVTGPLYVLARQRPGMVAPRLIETERVADPDAYRAARGFGEPVRFEMPVGDGVEVLTLLGVETRTLAGTGERLLVYHWFAETELTLPYRVIARVRRGDGPVTWSEGRTPAWAVLPTVERTRGTVVREARLVLVDERAAVAPEADPEAPPKAPGEAVPEAPDDAAVEELWLAVERPRDALAPVRASVTSAVDADGFVRAASLAADDSR